MVKLLSDFGRLRLAAVSGSGGRPVPLWRTLHAQFGARFWFAGLLQGCSDAAALTGPLLVNAIIRHAEGKPSALEAPGSGPTLRVGLTLATLLLLTGISQSILLNHFIHGVFTTGVLGARTTKAGGVRLLSMELLASFNPATPVVSVGSSGHGGLLGLRAVAAAAARSPQAGADDLKRCPPSLD